MRRIIRILLGVIAVILVVAVAAYLILAARVQPMTAHPFFRAGDRLLVIAHQGGEGERPSNTLMAMQHAVDIGADVLEMDIHASSDGVIVLSHDETVDRFTDGTGLIREKTFVELQLLDAAYDWVPTLEQDNPDAVPEFRGQGVTMPALEEVFAAFPDMRMVIEIKQESPSIAQPFCDLIREYGMEDQVIVASFRPASIYEFRRLCPEVATSAVEEEIRPYFILNQVGLTRVYQPTAHAFQVPEYSGSLHVVTQSFIDNLRPLGVVVQPWTINDDEGMRRMIALGVNGIITDYPSRLIELLNEG